MKRLGDMTLEQIDKEIAIVHAYLNASDDAPHVQAVHKLDLDQLLECRREILRRERHTTPHNKTRLGDLWPVATMY